VVRAQNTRLDRVRLPLHMPKHKTLKSVVRSVADQFTSLTNYVGDDYVMGHLVNAARASGQPTLHVNLLTGRAHPQVLLVSEVEKFIMFYTGEFANLVSRSQSDIAFIREALLTIRFDLARTKPRFAGDPFLETPYTCEVSMIDDRGKRYAASVSGAWYPEHLPYASRWDRVRRFLREFLRRRLHHMFRQISSTR
jgi:hypothetical protein